MNNSVNTKGVEDGISDKQNLFSYQHRHSDYHPSYYRLTSPSGLSLCLTDCDKDTAAFIAEANAPLIENKMSSQPAPTFSYQLAMYLTRNGADAPHMQAEINRFLYDGKWKTTQRKP